MRKHVALPGKTFCFSNGGIHFLTLVTKALTLQNGSNQQVTLTLIMPRHLELTPLRLIRSTLGRVKKFLLQALGNKKQKDYVPGRTLIHALRKINKDIKVVYCDDDDTSLRACLKKMAILS